MTAQPERPDIKLVESDTEVTLYIDGNQAMQAWERDLMFASADILCRHGSVFLEVGLGLGLSALRIASHGNTRQHTVIEKYAEVIELFERRHAPLPPTLRIEQADFFEHVHTLEEASLDGIFFDPWLPQSLALDEALWDRSLPAAVRALRPGGAFIPFFTTRPVLKWPFYKYFDRVIVERMPFTAYATTEYTSTVAGDAYVQCFIKSG